MREQFRAILAALEFIEGRLCDPISVADIAAAAGYSLYHFIRTFNQTVQHTPYDYLMRRRLSKAARELLQSQRRVIDIALDFQFNNHETFTRAFVRVFGVPPTEWREQGFPDSRLILPALDEAYLTYLSAPDFEFPRLVTLDEIMLAGLMAPVTSEAEDLSALWQNLRGASRSLWLNSKPGDFWGIRLPTPMPGGCSFYFAALKIPSHESTPEALVTKKIPAGDYLCLPIKNLAAHEKAARIYLYHTFLPKSGLRLAGSLEIEHFGAAREILILVLRPQKGGYLSSENVPGAGEDPEPV